MYAFIQYYISMILSLSEEQKKFGAVLVLILLITFIAFSPCLKNSFVNWDDGAYVFNNESIKSLSAKNVTKIFSSYICGYYQPITILSFALEYHFFKLDPKIYHINNIILHLLNVYLLAVFIYLLTGNWRMALMASALFGIHPLRVESVAWITERKDVLSGFFFLATMMSYFLYRKAEKHKGVFYGMTIALTLFTICSKLIGLTLPFVLLLIDFYLDRKKILFKNKIPFFLISLVFGVIAIYGSYLDLELLKGVSRHHAILDRIFMAGYALSFYFTKFFLPFNLSCLYPYPKIVNGFLPVEYYVSSCVLFIFAMVFIIKRKFNKNLIFGLLFFLINIALTLPIVDLGYALVSDRFTYIPYIGLFFILGKMYTFLTAYKGRFRDIVNNVARFGFAIFIVLCGFLTFQRCLVWHDSERLWTNVISQYPQAEFAYYSRGSYRYKREWFGLAEQDLKTAISIDPNFAMSYFSLGNLYSKQRKLDFALKNYTRVLEINPEHYSALNNRGNINFILGYYAEAMSDYTEAIRLKPDHDRTYVNRGILFQAEGEIDKALADFDRALRIDPGNKVAAEKRTAILKKK